VASNVRFKTYIRDQVRRRWEHATKPVRIVMGLSEYKHRRRVAESVNLADCFDLPTLNSNGYIAIALPETLKTGLIDACNVRMNSTQEFKQRKSKAFFSQLLIEEDYNLSSMLMKVALDEKILRTVAAYLKCAPFLESVELLLSKPIEGPPSTSQLWHRDRTDIRIIKLFVYANDVDADTGPFTLLPKGPSDRVPERLHHYLADDEMSKYVPTTEIRQLQGIAGTANMIDTQACFHLGSRCKKPRLAYCAYYTSGFGYRARENAWHLKYKADELTGLTELQRLALGID